MPYMSGQARALALQAARLSIVFGAAAATNLAGRYFEIESGVSILFPVTAVSIVACVWLGIPGLLAVGLGTMATPWGPHITPWQLVLSALLVMVEGIVPWLMFRLAPSLSRELNDMRSLGYFLLFGTVINSGISAFLGNALVVQQPAGTLFVPRQLFMWWISDFSAALLIATPLLAFGGTLFARNRGGRPRTMANVLQVVTVIILLGFGASFAMRTWLLGELETERLNQQQRWLGLQERLNRLHLNFIDAAAIMPSADAARHLADAEQENRQILAELAPRVGRTAPEVARNFPVTARALTQWFADAEKLAASGPVQPIARVSPEHERYLLDLRASLEWSNARDWRVYEEKRRKITLVATMLDAIVFCILVSASAVMVFTMSRPFRQLRSAVKAMGNGEALDASRIDGRFLEFRSVAQRLEEASRELRRREEELRLESEKALAASRHKSDFLAKMSHELRTPLNSIIGFSDLLTEQEATISPAKRLSFLATVSSSAKHLLALISDLLDIAKVESGKLELQRDAADLRLSIANTVASMQPLFARKSQQLDVIVPGEPMLAIVDRARIEQVLLNLLSNANKFTPAGESISLRARGQDGAWIIEISDTGVGISAEDQQRIFEEFEQVRIRGVHPSGTGLGLALARRFVEAHGGSIEVESEAGKGALFRIAIPAE